MQALGGDLFIRNVSYLVTCDDRDRVLKNVSVLVRNGVISRIFENDSSQVQQEAGTYSPDRPGGGEYSPARPGPVNDFPDRPGAGDLSGIPTVDASGCVLYPGLVNTDIGNKTTGIVDFVWKFRKRFGVHPSVSAQDFLYLCEQCEPPAGLYFHRGKSKKYNKQVTTENATRLFKLSEQLCNIRYE